MRHAVDSIEKTPAQSQLGIQYSDAMASAAFDSFCQYSVVAVLASLHLLFLLFTTFRQTGWSYSELRQFQRRGNWTELRARYGLAVRRTAMGWKEK